MKKLSFFLMAMLMSVMSFAQTTESVVLASGVHDGSKITWTIANGNITISQLKAASSTAVNASYISAPRMYKGHIFKFETAEGYAITNIDITYNGSYYGTDLFAGTVISNDNTVTKNTTDITATYSTATGGTHKIATTSAEGESMIALQIPNSAASGYKQLRPTAIKITYVKAATTTPNISCGDVTFGTVNSINNNTKEVEVVGENLSEAITATLETGAAFSVEGTLNANGGILTIKVTATEEGNYTDNLVLTSGTTTKTVAVSAKVVTCEGKGTKEAPYTVSDLTKLGNPGTKAWVMGYIIGEIKDNELSTSGFESNSNIALADAIGETKKYAPIQLPSGAIRDALNLVSNPANLNKQVALYGTLEAYFSMPGVKSVSEYEWVVAPVVNHTITVSANPAEAGTVTGGGEFEETDEITVEAVANEGYEFVNWTEDEVEVSTDAEYTFEVLADRALVANFKEVEPVKLYLNAKDWGYGDARFAAYFFDPAKWVDMTKVEGETYIYEVEVPAGYTQVIFVRMNGNTTENNWDNKWNQTGNLTIPTDGKNMFKPDDWNDKTTTWSTYTPSVKYTFTEGSTWYIDFSAITGKKGANYPKTNVADIDYSANAGGTVIPVTFTADVTWAEGATFIKTEEGGWDALTFTTPTEGANCAQVAADGKSYTWTTYVPVVIYTVTATAENGTVEGAGDYEEGTEVTLTATAAEGYEFVNWTKGEEVVSTENPYTFVVTADVALVANFAVVEPEVIAYELNGGELPTATVPTQDSLIAAFKDGYNAYFGVSVATTRAIDNFLYAGAAVNVPTCDVSLFMKDDASPWKWLGDYVLAVTNAQIEAGTLSTLKELATELMWRQSLTGFFLQQTKLDSNYKGNADFTEAGKPEAWGAAYQAAHAVVLPTEPVDAPYTLPTPVKDGFTFVGWYDNAEGTGEAYTVIPAGWSGTLYAIWKQSPATALENIAVEGKAVKAIINGQLIIIKNGVQYNAQGAVVK